MRQLKLLILAISASVFSCNSGDTNDATTSNEVKASSEKSKGIDNFIGVWIEKTSDEIPPDTLVIELKSDPKVMINSTTVLMPEGVLSIKKRTYDARYDAATNTIERELRNDLFFDEASNTVTDGDRTFEKLR
jgi:hypothetical protein